jgi:hypothetical protein
MDKTTLKVRRYKAGFEVRTERVMLGKRSKRPEDTVTVQSAYTPDGAYIGDPRMARLLIVKRGIKPELRTPESRVCSIGFCEREQKWYGWSHRAIYGFGIGDTFDEGDCGAGELGVGFTAKTLDDAKRMACAFAASVS